MGQDEGQVGARVADDETGKSPEEIRREIEDTRQDLGDTAAALAAKTDVKARAKEKVDGVKQTIAEKKQSFSSSSGSGAGDGSGGGGGASAAQARAGDAVSQIKTKAQENPIQAAAIAAFVGGFLFGRLTSR